jgi:hypothetical protein
MIYHRLHYSNWGYSHVAGGVGPIRWIARVVQQCQHSRMVSEQSMQSESIT